MLSFGQYFTTQNIQNITKSASRWQISMTNLDSYTKLLYMLKMTISAPPTANLGAVDKDVCCKYFIMATKFLYRSMLWIMVKRIE